MSLRVVRVVPPMLLLLAVAIAHVACAPTIWQRAGNPADVAATLRRLPPQPAQPANSDRQPLAYLVLRGSKGPRLGAVNLATRQRLWTVPAKVTGRVVAGATLVARGDGEAVVAHDISDGRQRWRFSIPSGFALVGYAVDGDQVAVVSRGSNQLRGGKSQVVGLDGRTGGVRWRRELDTANVGAPAAMAGLVAVPNRSQFVSIFDANSGAPLADVLSKEQAANFVAARPEGLFYGFATTGLFWLTPETAAGVRSSPNYFSAKLPSFVRVNYERDMYRADLLDYTALDRSRVLWRIDTEAAKPRFFDDTVVAMNYRFFFAFNAYTGRLQWAYSQPEVESVSAVRQKGIILFVTADGEVVGLDPKTGARNYGLNLGDELVHGATFDTEGFAGLGEVGAAPELSAVLSGMVRDPDRRFTDMKLFAIETMRDVPGPEVTAELLRILGADEMPANVRQRAGQVLVARKDAGSSHLLVEAIRIHSDRIAGTKPLGLVALAQAAAELQAKDAAVPLAEHLALPETDPAAAAAIARALGAIGSEAALPALRDYLCMYRADTAAAGDPSALFATTDALVKMGQARDRELLFFVAEETRTVPALREHIHRRVTERPRGK